jgi:hypothetical protein
VCCPEECHPLPPTPTLSLALLRSPVFPPQSVGVLNPWEESVGRIRGKNPWEESVGRIRGKTLRDLSPVLVTSGIPENG